LGRPHALQRIPVPRGAPDAPVTAAQVRRRPAFVIRLRSASGRGLDGSTDFPLRLPLSLTFQNRPQTGTLLRVERGTLDFPQQVAMHVPRSEEVRSKFEKTQSSFHGVSLSR